MRHSDQDNAGSRSAHPVVAPRSRSRRSATRHPGVDTGIRFETGDAEADHEALKAAGADVDAEILRVPGVPPMFTFRDPDGNRLYIVERM